MKPAPDDISAAFDALQRKDKGGAPSGGHFNPFEGSLSKIVRIGELMDNLSRYVKEYVPSGGTGGFPAVYTQSMLEQRLPLLLQAVVKTQNAAPEGRELQGIWQYSGEGYVSVATLSALMEKALKQFPEDDLATQNVFLKFNAAAVNAASDYSGMKPVLKPAGRNFSIFAK